MLLMTELTKDHWLEWYINGHALKKYILRALGCIRHLPSYEVLIQLITA